MSTQLPAAAMMVPSVSTRVPVLEAGDLPFEEDWAVLEALGVSHAALPDHDLQEDQLAGVRFAAGMFD